GRLQHLWRAIPLHACQPDLHRRRHWQGQAQVGGTAARMTARRPIYETPEPLEDRLRKLEKINRALMSRVERSTDFSGNGFALFQTAILLEGQVSARTSDLKQTL